MPRGIRGSAAVAAMATPEARAKASARIKANRPRMQLRRLLKQIASADTSVIDAEIAKLEADLLTLRKMRDAILSLEVGGNGRPTKSIEERIADYLRAAGTAKPALIAADLDLAIQQVAANVADRPDLFERTGDGYRLKKSE